MKPTTFFFLIYIFLSLANAQNYILLGFENYKSDKEKISFKMIAKNLNNITFSKWMDLNSYITYLTNSSNPNSSKSISQGGNCTIDNNNLNDIYIYYSCLIPITNISNITEVKLEKNFGDEVEIKSLATEAMKNLVTYVHELYIFNLTNKEEKHGQFILKGEMHKNLNDNETFKIMHDNINGTLNYQNKGGLKYECKFSPTSIIDVTINQKTAESSKSKIYILAEIIDGKIVFPKGGNKPVEEINATVVSMGNFKQANNYTEDARGKIYFKCGDYALKNLKEYIKFYVNIYYNQIRNLRMLQTTEKIAVIGIKNTSEIFKNIISYDLTYNNTKNKNIVNITSPENITFSVNNSFIEEDNEMNIDFSKNKDYDILSDVQKKIEPLYLKNNKKNDYEKDNYDAKINSDSFSFDFETQEGILNNEKNAIVDVSYEPYNEDRFFDSCFLEEKGENSYSIKCNPKRSVYAKMNTLIIDITNLVNRRRLGSVSLRNLDEKVNSTLVADPNQEGVIDYTYDPKINTFIPKKNDSGLSGGAIAAIIIASIVAILAVVFLIYWFNRPIKPAIKNDIHPISANSSANINN